MKKNLKLWGVMLFLMITTQASRAQQWLGTYQHETGDTSLDIHFHKVKSWADEHFKDAKAQLEKESKYQYSFRGEEGEVGEYIRYKRWEWFNSTRLKSDGTVGYLQQGRPISKIKGSNLRLAPGTPTWKSIGYKSNTGGYWGMGKADCIGFHPTNANIFYVGSAGGGLFKTIDGGLNYTAIGDFLPISQVARIIVDAVTPSTIYIALGPKGGEKSMGIYKSTDAGITWKPTAMADDYSGGSTIIDMIVSPTNPNILLVAKSTGIFRTNNGGASWSRVTNWHCNDLIWRPGSAIRVYAAKEDYWGNSEVYVSKDAGATWGKLTNIAQQKVTLELTVTPANPDIIAYSRIDHSGVEGVPNIKRLYVSKSNGLTGSFKYKSNLPQEEHIFISGIDEKVFYNGGVDIAKSIDSGKTWKQITTWQQISGLQTVHADVRNIYHSKTDAGQIYFCNDGGVLRYTEKTDAFTELNNGLQITQYYSIACAQSNSIVVAAGSQDNGGSRRNANATWINTNGGDAMAQAIDPTNANIMYSTYILGELYRSTDGWVTNQTISNNIVGGKPNGEWVTPYVLDPKDPTVIVAGYDNVYLGINRGESWQKISNNMTNGGTIKALAVAPSNTQVIYCSANQNQLNKSEINKFFYTSNRGVSWGESTLPTNEKITEITVHSTLPNLVWATVGGWSTGDKVYASIDGGKTWKNYSEGLPNVPTNTIIYQKGNVNNALYVGNDIGIYYRDKTMSRWETYSAGLPNTRVTDLDIQYSAKLLRAATYGRGAWEAPLIATAAQIEDCAGVAGGSAKMDNCDVCAGGATGIVANTSCCSPGILVAVERWNNVNGNNVSDIPLSTAPTETIYIKDLEKNFLGLDNFGTRIKGTLCPPETGTYTFWIKSDDQSELWISTNDQPATKVRRAYVDGAVSDYDATATQKSIRLTLTKGSKYYFEVIYKEGGGDAHFAVAWAYGSQPRTIIKGAHIVQSRTANTPPSVTNSEPSGIITAVVGAENAALVMPNPAIDVFTIRSQKSIQLLYVIDSQGRQVFSTIEIAEGTNFDFGRDFASGIYNVAVIYKDGSMENYKILKTK